jgi:transposase
MGQTPTIRALTADEVQQLKAGLCSPKAFTLRRCQILLASAQGLLPSQFAGTIGCTLATVRNVLSDFHGRGVACVYQERLREGALPRGRPRVEEKQPGITAALERLMANDIAGDPMTEKRWVRVTLTRLSEQLRQQGFRAVEKTVRRLLKQMGFSMKANKRRQVRSRCPERDEQFRYIASQKQAFAALGLPVISVDTKKKELIGPFRNAGKAWCREAEEVDEHDFPSAAECLAVPFGVYDVTRNVGCITVGVSHNTPEFAASAIARWWETDGLTAYPGAIRLLILADGGGGNGNRCRAWKLNLQERLCDRFGLEVTVCHYPPGCSKWNPVEHRLFSEISKNWAGKPLRTLEAMLGYIRGTTTTTGLTVKAHLDEGTYRKGQKVTKEDVKKINFTPHSLHPRWNYTISPVQQPYLTP